MDSHTNYMQLIIHTCTARMTKKKPMTASERQKKVKKHAATVAKAKENAKKRKPPTPQPSQSSSSPEEKSDSPLQTNSETQNQENLDVGPDNPRCGGDGEGPSGVAPDENEEGPSSVAPNEDDDNDGGPVNKSVLTSFKDHIAYAIWNRTQGWICEHFPICPQSIHNMEYTEMQPRMCR
ncbi:hypothetical protein LguiA_004026 [Lonicera macranthoides]